MQPRLSKRFSQQNSRRSKICK